MSKNLYSFGEYSEFINNLRAGKKPDKNFYVDNNGHTVPFYPVDHSSPGKKKRRNKRVIKENTDRHSYYEELSPKESEDLEKKLHEHQKEALHDPSGNGYKDDIHPSISEYTSGSHDLNMALIDRHIIGSPLLHSYEKQTSDLLRGSIHSVGHPHILYSGIKHWDPKEAAEASKDGIIHLPAFTSASTSNDKARTFSKGHMLKIHMKPEDRAIHLGSKSPFGQEYESILPPGTRLKYIKHEPDDGNGYEYHHFEVHSQPQSEEDYHKNFKRIGSPEEALRDPRLLGKVLKSANKETLSKAISSPSMKDEHVETALQNSNIGATHLRALQKKFPDNPEIYSHPAATTNILDGAKNFNSIKNAALNPRSDTVHINRMINELKKGSAFRKDIELKGSIKNKLSAEHISALIKHADVNVSQLGECKNFNRDHIHELVTGNYFSPVRIAQEVEKHGIHEKTIDHAIEHSPQILYPSLNKDSDHITNAHLHKLLDKTIENPWGYSVHSFLNHKNADDKLLERAYKSGDDIISGAAASSSKLPDHLVKDVIMKGNGYGLHSSKLKNISREQALYLIDNHKPHNWQHIDTVHSLAQHNQNLKAEDLEKLTQHGDVQVSNKARDRLERMKEEEKIKSFSDSDLSSKELHELIRDENFNVAKAAINHKSITKQHLESAMDDPNVMAATKIEALNHKLATSKMVHAGLKHESSFVNEAAISSPGFKKEHAEHILNSDEYHSVRKVLQDPHASKYVKQHHVDKIVDSYSTYLQRALLGSNKLSKMIKPHHIDKLMHSYFWEVRLHLANHPNATREHLEQLANDNDYDVQHAAKKALKTKYK